MPANEVKRTVMPGIGSTPEPDKGIGIITLVVSNLAEAEHRPRVATPRRIAIPSASALNVTLDAYSVQVEPPHRKNRVRVTRLRRLGVERECALLVLGDAVPLQNIQ